MKNKTFLTIAIGVLCAGIVCIIVGLIVYLAIKNNAIATLISLFTMISGGIMSSLALLVIIANLIINKISNDKE